MPMPIPIPMPSITAPGGGPCGPTGRPDCAMSESVGGLMLLDLSVCFLDFESSLFLITGGRMTGIGAHGQVGASAVLVGCGVASDAGVASVEGACPPDGLPSPAGVDSAAALAFSDRLRTRSSS